ncbi:hypothetical protein ACIF6I_35505 [Streptomyces microflavus]|uniref:hypothetical protein n=1 Tax=Streptomyces microflavus TaxID=1919 RepID=UPI0037D4F1E0
MLHEPGSGAQAAHTRPSKETTRDHRFMARPTCMFSLLHDVGAQYLASALFAASLAASAWARKKWRSRGPDEPGNPESSG